MKKIIKFSLMLSVLFLPYLTNAHGYWLETKGSGKVGEPVKVLMFYGEYASEIRERGNKLDKMADILVSIIDVEEKKTDLKMTQTETHWEGSFTPNQEGNYQILGINDSREVQDWKKHNLGITRPIQFLRTNYLVGNSAQSSSKNYQFLDLVASKQGEFIALTAFKGNLPMDKTKITITNPQSWEKVKTTNEKGRVTFFPSGKGMYLVEVEWIDNQAGKLKDKEYESIRYKSETTLVVD